MVSICSLFFLPALTCSSNEAETFEHYLDKANKYIRSYKHFEASDALKEAVRLGGEEHPVLHMRLGILYYGLGLIPKAIAEGEKAVELEPTSKWYRYDLAKFYFVDKQLDRAEQQLVTLLKIDPGFTHGYHYLAELLSLKKDYDMAWLSLQRARLLGSENKQLEEQLAPLSNKPREEIGQEAEGTGLFRFIKINSLEEAQAILTEISTGKLFENFELELKKNQHTGTMLLSELPVDKAESLVKSQPYSPPSIISTGSDYLVIQRILPFDQRYWKTLLERASPTGRIQQASEPAVVTLAREPAPSKSSDSKQLLSDKIAAIYAVENWKMAWSEKNVAEYLNAYSSRFNPPGGLNLEAWKEKRNRSLTTPKFIHIETKELVAEILDEKRLQITFQQSYESDSYQDRVLKRLTLEKESSGWKIISEEELQKLAP